MRQVMTGHTTGGILTMLLILSLVVGLSSCTTAGQSGYDFEDNQHVVEWIDLAYSLVSLERQTPPVASRTYAYVMIGLYEGWVHGLEDRHSLSGHLNGLDKLPQPQADTQYDWATVATTTAYEVSQHAYGEETRIATIRALDDLKQDQLDRQRSQGISEEILNHSEVYGIQLAEALITWMDSDRYHDTRQLAYTPSPGPDAWTPTADYGITLMLDATTQVTHLFDQEGDEMSQAEMIMRRWQSEKMLHMNHPGTISNWQVAQEPHWRQLRPLIIDLDEYSALPHKPYSEADTSLFYEELLEVYNVSQTVTDEQLQTAHFWMDGPGETGTPAGHWLKLASQLSNERGLTLSETLELLVVTSTAMYDTHIACWNSKFEHNLVRPKTLIRRWIDEHWDAPIPIPNHPEYPSGHASTSGAAAVPLTVTFGDISFIDETHKHRYGFAERSYRSFADAAQEAADSRLYAGLHFPMGNQNGLEQGERVGRTVTETLLATMRGEEVNVSQRVPGPLFDPIPHDQSLSAELAARWRADD